jgi:hypothetical protein
MAIHGALGLDFMGHRLQDGPFKSIVYNAYDDLMEQSRRTHAICRKYGFDEQKAGAGIMLIGAEDLRIKLTTGKEGTPNIEQIKELVTMAAREDVGMLVLDPLVSLHSLGANSNKSMGIVREVLCQIADEADVAVLLVGHHESELDSDLSAGDASSLDAGTMLYNCPINLTLSEMTVEEAEQYGISEEDRLRFSRLDDAEMKYSLRRGSPIWIKMHSVDVTASGQQGIVDSVGVPMPFDMAKKTNRQTFQGSKD